MVDPISNQQFSHDYQKFVLQEISAIPIGPYGTPKFPFESVFVNKTKKDLKKEKNSPFEIKQKKDENKDKDEKESEEVIDEDDDKSN
jgi:hypothetical protein